MPKERLSVYLEPQVMRTLEAYANHRSKSLSLIAETAIASLTSPDAPERQEAALTKRLDRLSRQVERLQRDLTIATEAHALFVRFWLQATPQISEQQQASLKVKGIERYAAFIEALGRRLASERSLFEEVSAEKPRSGGRF